MTYSANDYLETIHDARGVGYWRALYLSLLGREPLCRWESIIELGAGAPEFLERVPFTRRVAVDIGVKHQAAFHAAGIELHAMDLENGSFDGFGKFDVAVCSDVFEHLLWPQNLLVKIPDILTAVGSPGTELEFAL